MTLYTEEDEKQPSGTDALIAIIENIVQDKVNDAVEKLRYTLKSDVKAEIYNNRKDIARDIIDEVVKGMKQSSNAVKR
jgi:hypothetical protein